MAPPGTDFATEGTDAPVAVFLLQPLQSLVLHCGTWHWGPYPTHSDGVRLFNVQGLRYAEDNEMVDLAALGLTVVVDRS